MLEKMDFLFDHYKRKTLVSHTCPMKSPFTEVRVKVQKNHANQAICNVYGEEKGSP